MLRRSLAIVALSLLACTLGCYGTRFKLIDPAKASVDRSFCGDWRVDNAGDPNQLVTLHVRNLDDHQYVLSWANEVDGKVDEYVGFVAEIKDATFVHARPLPADGSLADSYILVRFAVEGDELTLRQLNKDFMDNQKIDSDDALRRVVTDHLNSDEMYDPNIQKARRIVPNP